MNQGIVIGITREDYRNLAYQLYETYAQGKDARALSAIVGEEALSETDRKFLKIAKNFERKFVNQGTDENRSIEQTLDIGWELLSHLPESEMKRIKSEFITKYRKRINKDGEGV
jgi:V/A-type H+-transporting ATPase subunit B